MESRTKIAHINTVDHPRNAVAQVMSALHGFVRENGFESRIFVGNGSRECSDHRMQGAAGRWLNALTARLKGTDGFLAEKSTYRLLRRLDEFGPDLVHIHNLHGYYINARMLLEHLAATHTPVIVTCHDLWLATGRCAVPAACGLYLTHSCDQCPHADRYPALWRQKATISPHYKDHLLSPLDAHLVVPSEAMAEAVKATTLAHLPVSVIENGVDKSVFSPTPNTGNHSGLQLIAVASRWNAEKNGAALTRLAGLMPSDWHLTVVGSDFPKSDRIRVIRHVGSPSELARLYREADVLLSPSFSESFGMTVAEANACGTPAVVNSDAVPSIRPTDNNVLSVNYSDTNLLIDAITRAASHKADPALVSSIADMQKKYLSLYRQILQNPLN